MVNKKEMVEHLHEYSAVCSYDELKRFRSSAAFHASSKLNSTLRNHNAGLVQSIADNFDCNISSMNGLRQTHSLALMMIQSGEDNNSKRDDIFSRLKVADMKDEDLPGVDIIPYRGSKKPDMPEHYADTTILPPEFIAKQEKSAQLNSEFDFQFLKSIIIGENIPEYSGFNTQRARESGQSLQKSTTAIYQPLIDAKPSDHSTILTAMKKAMELTASTDQSHTIFTCDQQLYKILVDIKWEQPHEFEMFIPRLGGMHFLMSYIGGVGTLMRNSGLEDLLKSAFGGVDKMLSGKNFPQNFRALRMVVEAILGDSIGEMINDGELMEFLEHASQESRTSKLWIDNLIKPVQLMMLFVRAEREGDWPLHLYAVEKMIPLFFAAGHHNYARYGLCYLNDMKKLPDYLLVKFMRGEHVTRHQRGYWNGIWSDMFIETTFMRYGKGPGGVIGITLKPKVVKKWAYSLQICTQLIHDLHKMRKKKTNSDKLIYKEESAGRIKSDNEDRSKIKKKLEEMIHPLKTCQHNGSLINIASGKIYKEEDTNADNAAEVGTKQMNDFIASLPNGFHFPIKKDLKLIPSERKRIKVGETEIYNTEAIYARVMSHE